jgi:hypothetical protein
VGQHPLISMTSIRAHELPQVMTNAADRIGQALWGLPRSQLQLNCNWQPAKIT